MQRVPCCRQLIDGDIASIFPKTTEPAVTSKPKCDAITKRERIEVCRPGLPSLPVFQVDYLAYLGMNAIMGIHVLPQIENYWSSDDYLGFRGITVVMSRSRFKKITQYLHINDNTTTVARGERGYDPLHKIRPLLSATSNSFALDVTCLSTRRWLRSRGGPL